MRQRKDPATLGYMGIAMGKLIGYPATMWGDPYCRPLGFMRNGGGKYMYASREQSHTLREHEI